MCEPDDGRRCGSERVIQQHYAPRYLVFHQLQELQLVERQLNDLPIAHRAVVVLRSYLDLPLDEVADILDSPSGP